MFKQIVEDWHREDDVLTLTLKRDFGRTPPHVTAMFIVWALFVFFVIGASSGSGVLVFGVLAVLLVGGFFLSRLIFATTTLRFDAATLQMQTEWFRFLWPTWESSVPVKGRCRICDRSKLPKPVSRVVFQRDEWKPTPGRFELLGVRTRFYRYEIRFPLAEREGRGVICNLETESRMNELQAEIDRFWNEVPCEVSLPEKEHEIDRGEDRQEKVVAESEPTESSKDYAFNRGEDFSGHGAEPPVTVQESRGEQPMVTMRETFNERRNEKSLTLISERGGPASRILGRTSLWIYRLVQLAFFVGVIGIFVYWERFEPPLVDWCNRLNAEIFNFFGFPADEDKMMVAGLKRELNVDPFMFRIFFGLLFVLLLFAVVASVVDSLLQILHWPFWGRWKVRFRHSPRHSPRGAHRVTSDWLTDRGSGRSKRLEYEPFFLAIPATPTTHRMVSGRKFWDRNPGWDRPLQVVIVTAEGSFPLPVAGPEEQRHVIERLEKFVANTKEPGTERSAVPG